MFKTILSSGFIQLITIASSILLSRYLGPEGRGNLAIIFFYPQLCMTLSLIGFDRGVSIGVRENIIYRENLGLPIYAFFFSIVSALVSAALISYRINDLEIKHLAFLYLFYIPPVSLFILTSSLLNGRGYFNSYNSLRLIFYFSNALILSSFLVFKIDTSEKMFYAVMANLAAGYSVGIISLGLLFMARASNPPSNTRSSNFAGELKSLVKSFVLLFRIASKFIPSLSLVYISAGIPQFVAITYLPPALIGVFVVNFTYSKLGTAVSSAVSTHIFYDGIAGLDNDFYSKFRRITLVYILISVFLIISSRGVISLAFGSDFYYGNLFIFFLVIGGLCSQISDLISEYLRGRQIIRSDNISLTIYSLALFILGSLFLYKFQLIGFSVAIFLAEIFRLVSLIYFSQKYAGINSVELCSFNSDDFLKIWRDAIFFLRKIYLKR
jgi:O-antigen/teichoic acid export membrane protein